MGAYSGRFNAERLLKALSEHRFTNSKPAAATHYRMMKNCGKAGDYLYAFDKLSFTGEPIDDDTADYVAVFGLEVCSMYGTTEIGVVLVSYPGAPDFPVKRGSLGKAVPARGSRWTRRSADGSPGETGQFHATHGRMDLTKDLGRTDEDATSITEAAPTT